MLEKKFQPVDAKSLANLILDWSDQKEINISHMKLQKIVYFCHADFLVSFETPLILQQFEAWEYGPIIPSLFDEFKLFGATPITGRASRFDPVSCHRECAPPCLLGEFESPVRASFEVYARYTAATLSNMSHMERGPWDAALKRFERGSPKGRSIENDLIAKFHIHPFRQSSH